MKGGGNSRGGKPGKWFCDLALVENEDLPIGFFYKLRPS